MCECFSVFSLDILLFVMGQLCKHMCICYCYQWTIFWSSGSTVTVLNSVLCESRTRWRTIRLQSASERGRWTRKVSQASMFTVQIQNFVASDMPWVWSVLPTSNVCISSLFNFTFGLFGICDWSSSYRTLPCHWTSLSLMPFSFFFFCTLSLLLFLLLVVLQPNMGHGVPSLEVF